MDNLVLSNIRQRPTRTLISMAGVALGVILVLLMTALTRGMLNDRIRREQGVGVPILVLTARGSWHEKVEGIDGGADDYVSKPFRMEEVLARLRALLRRAQGHAAPRLTARALCLDPRTAAVTRDNQPVKLTAQEYRVFSYLMHHAGRVVSQAELAEHIYAVDGDRDSNTVEVFIARLRRKLGADAITTVRGLGYRLEA